jgi:hypothetical protein
MEAGSALFVHRSRRLIVYVGTIFAVHCHARRHADWGGLGSVCNRPFDVKARACRRS